MQVYFNQMILGVGSIPQADKYFFPFNFIQIDVDVRRVKETISRQFFKFFNWLKFNESSFHSNELSWWVGGFGAPHWWIFVLVWFNSNWRSSILHRLSIEIQSLATEKSRDESLDHISF